MAQFKDIGELSNDIRYYVEQLGADEDLMQQSLVAVKEILEAVATEQGMDDWKEAMGLSDEIELGEKSTAALEKLRSVYNACHEWGEKSDAHMQAIVRMHEKYVVSA